MGIVREDFDGYHCSGKAGCPMYRVEATIENGVVSWNGNIGEYMCSGYNKDGNRVDFAKCPETTERTLQRRLLEEVKN